MDSRGESRVPEPLPRVESISALFVSEPDEADAVQQRLLHFLGAAPWPDDEVRRTVVRFALADLTQRAPPQSLSVDDTWFPTSGSHSVGVQRQSCGVLGKLANCQVIVSLTAATERAHLPIDAQPYLPQKWTDSEALRKQAYVSPSLTFRSKPDLALSMRARTKQNGIPPAVVLARGVRRQRRLPR
jgi:SRSO17 transposase